MKGQKKHVRNAERLFWRQRILLEPRELTQRSHHPVSMPVCRAATGLQTYLD